MSEHDAYDVVENRKSEIAQRTQQSLDHWNSVEAILDAQPQELNAVDKAKLVANELLTARACLRDLVAGLSVGQLVEVVNHIEQEAEEHEHRERNSLYQQRNMIQDMAMDVHGWREFTKEYFD